MGKKAEKTTIYVDHKGQKIPITIDGKLTKEAKAYYREYLRNNLVQLKTDATI